MLNVLGAPLLRYMYHPLPVAPVIPTFLVMTELRLSVIPLPKSDIFPTSLPRGKTTPLSIRPGTVTSMLATSLEAVLSQTHDCQSASQTQSFPSFHQLE